MKLLTLRRHVEREPSSPRIGLRVWTWTLEVSPWSVGLYERWKAADDPPGEEGRLSDEYSANLMRHWGLGGYHAWYDGPHCCFSVGFLHLNWRNWSCEKCAAGR